MDSPSLMIELTPEEHQLILKRRAQAAKQRTHAELTRLMDGREKQAELVFAQQRVQRRVEICRARDGSLFAVEICLAPEEGPGSRVSEAGRELIKQGEPEGRNSLEVIGAANAWAQELIRKGYRPQGERSAFSLGPPSVQTS